MIKMSPSFENTLGNMLLSFIKGNVSFQLNVKYPMISGKVSITAIWINVPKIK